jgi:hypothetical protein
MKTLIGAILVIVATSATAQSSNEVVCSYAPSQSNAIAAISGAAGGAGATIGAVAAATGLTVVTHSSGALILSGASGYIAGTIGTAALAPVIIGVSLVVGGTAVVVEVVCANKNHPEMVAKVKDAAVEFAHRFGAAMEKTKIVVGDMSKSISPAAKGAVVKAKEVTDDVWKYAYKKSVETAAFLNR